MSEAPTSQDQPDVVDETYRQASAADSSKPSEFARRKLLAHAAQVAAERAVKQGASASAPRFNAPEPAANKIRSLIIVGGIVAVAAIAGVLIIPPLLAPSPKPLTAPAPIVDSAPPPMAQATPPRADTDEPTRSSDPTAAGRQSAEATQSASASGSAATRTSEPPAASTAAPTSAQPWAVAQGVHARAYHSHRADLRSGANTYRVHPRAGV